MTDFGGKTSIFSHPVYLFLRKFSLQDSRGGSVSASSIRSYLSTGIYYVHRMSDQEPYDARVSRTVP
ncbi:hypothetical protein A3410_26740 [Escherichia coli]|nr:hypothetical protein [Escherichia coli]